MFARLTNELGIVVVERRTWIGMTGWLWLLVIMTKLDDDIVARLQLVEHFLPAAFIDKTLR